MSDNLPSRLTVWEADLRQKCEIPLISQVSELEKILLYIHKEYDLEKISSTLQLLELGQNSVRRQIERLTQCDQKLEEKKRLLQSQDVHSRSSGDTLGAVIRPHPSRQDKYDSGISLGSSVVSLRLSELNRTSKEYEPEGDSEGSSRSSYCSVPEDTPSNDLNKPGEARTTFLPEARAELSRTPTVFSGTNIEDNIDNALDSFSDNETTSGDQGLRESVFMRQLDPEEKQFLENKPTPRNPRNKAPTL